MKILHTADWHLGKKLEYFSRFEEQKALLQEIVAIIRGRGCRCCNHGLARL